MKPFDESFYTDDYDQEMMEFIESNYDKSPHLDEWNVNGYLGYSNLEYINYFWTGEHVLKTKLYLTKQQFKEKIGMKDTFTKYDLVAGKHVVEFNTGIISRCLVMSSIEEDIYLLREGFCFTLGNDIFKGDFCVNFYVSKVFAIKEPIFLQELHDNSKLQLVWERPEQSEAQKQLSDLQEQIKVLQSQADELSKDIK